MEKITITFNLNEQQTTIETQPNKRLLDFLREDCGMTSVKEGCSEGECGACTVLLNNKPVTSCLMLAGQAEGQSITTLEGVSKDGELDTIQQAFIEAGAVQCGFCTPAMVLSARALLIENKNPTRDEIKRAISGNLCRCTGYSKIVHAIELAAKK